MRVSVRGQGKGAFTLAFFSRYEGYEFSPLAHIGHVFPTSHYNMCTDCVVVLSNV